MYYCLWKDARIVYNLKSLHVPSLTTGTTSNNPPYTNTVLIIASILVGMVMLLVGITLLVIGVILIVKRKRRTPTVQYDKESKVQIYNKVNNYVKSTKDTADTGDGKAYNDYKGIEDDEDCNDYEDIEDDEDYEDYEDYADSEYEERMTTWTSPSNMLQSK